MNRFKGDFGRSTEVSMGGLGSGRLPGWGRLTVDDVPLLDVAVLHDLGHFGPARKASTLTWSFPHEVTVQCRGGTHGVSLFVRSAPDNRWTLDDYLPVEWVRCRLGGERPFFGCPSCERRVLHLYLRERFRCRRCTDLRYPSQREDEFDRARRRAHKLRCRLQAQKIERWEAVPRPKGMWRKTFKRLEERLFWAEDSVRTAFVDRAKLLIEQQDEQLRRREERER
jgi:hypothetical protein